MNEEIQIHEEVKEVEPLEEPRKTRPLISTICKSVL